MYCIIVRVKGRQKTVRIKEARKMRNISGPVLAEKIGITSQFLYDIENGKCRARVDLLEKIANELNVSLDYLVGRTDDPRPLPNPDDLKKLEELRETIELAFQQFREIMEKYSSPKNVG